MTSTLHCIPDILIYQNLHNICLRYVLIWGRLLFNKIRYLWMTKFYPLELCIWIHSLITYKTLGTAYAHHRGHWYHDNSAMVTTMHMLTSNDAKL